jgi:hypothetical protein
MREQCDDATRDAKRNKKAAQAIIIKHPQRSEGSNASSESNINNMRDQKVQRRLKRYILLLIRFFMQVMPTSCRHSCLYTAIFRSPIAIGETTPVSESNMLTPTVEDGDEFLPCIMRKAMVGAHALFYVDSINADALHSKALLVFATKELPHYLRANGMKRLQQRNYEK